MARPGTKPRIDEELYRPHSLDEALELHRQLTEAGIGNTQAWSIVGWLLKPDHINSLPQASASVQRSQYRAALLRLGAPPWAGTRAKVGTRDKGAYNSPLAHRRPRFLHLHRPQLAAA